MKSWIVVLILLLIFTILQSTVLCYFEICSIKPDIILIAVIYFALYGGRKFGSEIGITGGLLKDIVSGLPFGLSILSFGGLGFLVGSVGSRLYKESPFTQIILTIGSAVSISLFYYVGSYISRRLPPFSEFFRFIILPSGVYTALVSPAIFLMLRLMLKEKMK